ncbi:MAG: hypothetical protein Q7R60_04160 [bacterium]|nr:hypothetical protein [bacterium]
MAAPRHDAPAEELIEKMRSSNPGRRDYEMSKAFLDMRSSEATSRLTRQLAISSWVLSFATVILATATIVLASK